MGQRVAITGSSGLIGGALSHFLTARGDCVVQVVRHPPTDSGQARWDPQRRELPQEALNGVDAVVHLAGSPVSVRWTAANRREILASRTHGTYAVAEAIAASGRPIRLLSGSAMGFYGDRGDGRLTEDSSAGQGFLTDVVRAWEAAAEPAMAAGAPVAFLRTGLVLSSRGGAMARMLPLARLGLGGPLGSGRQWWSWITLADHVRAVAHLLAHPEITGPVNFVGPHPDRQRDVAAALGRQLGRPALLPAPAMALRAALGGFASEVLGSTRVIPQVLTDSGFIFDHADLPAAMAWVAKPS
ncbi:MAG: TIGR01777 family oxidoreductase [Nostocoides sp.]